MSKPEEKAKELIKKLNKAFWMDEKDKEVAKACTIICVDEILKVNQDAWSRIPDIGELEDYIPYIYWQLVKKEINKL